MANDLVVYEVYTEYKSGRPRIDHIAAHDENELLAIYDKRHNKELVKSSVIIGIWLSMMSK